MAFKMRGTPFKRNFGIGASPVKKTYAEAKKADPNLDSYIRKRKRYDAGSEEYEALQAKINKAYGKVRDKKLKAAQVKKVKERDKITAEMIAENRAFDKKQQDKANKEHIANIEKKAKAKVAAASAKRKYIVEGQADEDRKTYKKREMAKIKKTKKDLKKTAKGMTKAEREKLNMTRKDLRKAARESKKGVRDLAKAQKKQVKAEKKKYRKAEGRTLGAKVKAVAGMVGKKLKPKKKNIKEDILKKTKKSPAKNYKAGYYGVKQTGDKSNY